MSSYEELEACIELENKCAGIYRALSRLFPEAESLFRELAIEEENHALILKVARTYVMGDKLSQETVVPVSVLHIKESLKIADNIANEIESGDIILKKALDMSLLLERSLGESYLHDKMTGESDSEIILKLQKLHFDEGAHIKRIQDFLIKKGIE
ncbi:MAG: hypothetical protein Q7U10_04240 [Thermodesulfovibrionia bacterium]|nr:hypothetical protein [Thermodesulfovibrionia bacterium]